MNFRFYHVCNDFSLEPIEPNTSDYDQLVVEMKDMIRLGVEDNCYVYGYDAEEGPIYAAAPVGSEDYIVNWY